MLMHILIAQIISHKFWISFDPLQVLENIGGTTTSFASPLPDGFEYFAKCCENILTIFIHKLNVSFGPICDAALCPTRAGMLHDDGPTFV